MNQTTITTGNGDDSSKLIACPECGYGWNDYTQGRHYNHCSQSMQPAPETGGEWAIHGNRRDIVDRERSHYVAFATSDRYAVQIVADHNAVKIATQALWLIAPQRECENFTSGIGSCFRNGRSVDAEDGADRCCGSCIAHDALDRISQDCPVTH